MTGTKITMTGADEAHYESAIGLSSRVVQFPDGVTRHLTLKNAQWDILDRLCKDRDWPESAIPEMAFRLAREYCSEPEQFEQELREFFVRFLRVNAAHAMRVDDGVSNDDRPAPPHSPSE